jgi:hypothetical protein
LAKDKLIGETLLELRAERLTVADFVKLTQLIQAANV